MLHSESSPTKPAAAAALTVSKCSWIIGEACSRIPMPAVTLQKSTVHSSQNWGVRIALAAVTLPVVTSLRSGTFSGLQPSGCQPSAGTFTVNAPSIITTKYSALSVRNASAIASAGLDPYAFSSASDSGDAMSAPPPKPMIARPVARPGRSGNHLMSVETGEM
jgi:hypothetical protein